MLKLRIERRDCGAAWRESAGGWSAGDSHVTPFRNPALEHFFIGTADAQLFVVRERLASVAAPQPGGPVTPEHFATILAEVRSWPLEFTAVIVSDGVTIEAGGWGPAPLYLIACGDMLYGDWDPAALYRHLGPSPLDPAYAAHFLTTFDLPYSRRTLFGGLLCLTARSTAVWDAAGLRVDYPQAVPRARPRRLVAGADPPEMFRRILTSALGRRIPAAGDCVAAELSGGLDSGVVAGVAASLLPQPLHTFGLLMPEQQELQQRRRDEIVARFGSIDETMPAGARPPLARARSRDARVVPWEETYFEAADAIVAAAAARGAAVMLTGVGGDELCLPFGDELSPGERDETLRALREPRFPPFASARLREIVQQTSASLDTAPAAAMSSSALSGQAACTFLYLSHGMWPVSPLCTPELVWFCRHLPEEWRRNRRVQRDVLASLGCPVVAGAADTDDFSPVLVAGLRAAAPRVRELFTESRLADEGYVDRALLLAAFDRFVSTSGAVDEAVDLYAAASVELALRGIETART